MLNSSTSLHSSNSQFPLISSSPLDAHGTKTLGKVLETQPRRSNLSPAFPVPPLVHSILRTPERVTRFPLSRAAAESQLATISRVSRASDVIREFYDGINRRDLASVDPLIAEGCVYEDLIFSQPFVGRKAILDFFKKFTESISKELQFVIDDISNEDTSAVGVTWHLEWQGRPFPFSKGCSFYRLELLEGRRQIVDFSYDGYLANDINYLSYGRDCVEPAAKPGELALVLISGVTWLLQRFPQLGNRL